MNNIKIINIIFIISLVLLLINILYLTKNNKKLLLKMIYLKNVDNYFINYSFLSYTEMVNKLNKKQYNKNNSLSSFEQNSNHKTKKKLYLYIIDNHKNEIKFIKNILQSKYIIKFTPNNPDYLIYNVFECKHLNKNFKYSIKIAIFTENQIPDFNIADYGISHTHINYLDRHFTYQIYFFNRLLLFNKYYKKNRNKVLLNPIRKKFCAAVISN